MAAFITQNELTVGVMDAPLERLQKKRAYEYMESLDFRIHNVETFLRNVNRNLVYRVIPIYDDYGPTITDASIQALVGSLETYNGCKAGIYFAK
jgi:phosphopantetheine adenylyltransferase